MAQAFPGTVSKSLAQPHYLIDALDRVQGADVTLDSSNVDSGSTPTTLIRPGNVVVLRTSTGRYVEANDANGDRSAPAVVTSAEPVDGDWNPSTLTAYLNGVLVTTLVNTAVTTSTVVTALNAAFAAQNVPLVASGADGAALVVRGHPGGNSISVRMESTLVTAYATAGGAGSFAEDAGSDGDYRVTDDWADLLDAGVATHAPVRNLLSGHFDRSELVNLTADAEAVLARRGSIFG